MTDKEMQPWQWPEAHWRGILNQARAGRPLRPQSWPDEARCAFALSFDSDHETNELRDGGKSIGRLSWGQYGARVGVPRIAALLARHDDGKRALAIHDQQEQWIGQKREATRPDKQQGLAPDPVGKNPKHGNAHRQNEQAERIGP